MRDHIDRALHLRRLLIPAMLAVALVGIQPTLSNNANLNGAPGIPTGLKAKPSGAFAMLLKWSAPSGNLTGYDIEHRKGAKGEWEQIAKPAAGEKSYTDRGLESKTLYYYRMRAYNASGYSDYSKAAKKKTKKGSMIVTYHHWAEGGHVYWIEVKPGAKPFDVTAALDRLSPRAQDHGLNVSPDGEYFLVVTERFDPEFVSWPGLAVVAKDFSSGDAVRTDDGTPIHGEGLAALNAGANLIIYRDSDGQNHHLYMTGLLLTSPTNGGTWGQPVKITGNSPYKHHGQPVFSLDGSKVIFWGDNEPYGYGTPAICQVEPDGKNFKVLVRNSDGPQANKNSRVGHPSFGPDGTVYFVADWGGADAIWRINNITGKLEKVIDSNVGVGQGPNALPDGNFVVQVYKDYQGQEVYALKVVPRDGSDSYMLLDGVNTDPDAIGCAPLVK